MVKKQEFYIYKDDQYLGRVRLEVGAKGNWFVAEVYLMSEDLITFAQARALALAQVQQ